VSVRTQARQSFWALLAGAAIFAPPARADTEAIRIEYQADDSCPSAAVFTAEVFQRTSSARLASDGEQARTFSVLIVRSAAGVTGSLVIREPDGATVARKVSGRACEDVATVLALATALAIDPRAELDLGDAPGSPERSPSEPPSPPLPPATSEAFEPEPPPPPPRGPWTWNGAVGPSFAFGPAPQTAIGGSFLVERANRVSGSPVSSVGLELLYLNASPEDIGGATAAFQYFLARPRLCAFALGSADGLALAPCLGVDLGAVTGAGSNIPNEATRTRFWGSVDVLVRLSLALGYVFFVEVEGGLGLPLTRYQFVFRNPDTKVYDVPAGTGLLTVRLGVRQ
jgi:hypothetical protein